MNVLHLSTTDIIGGAARGAYSLHKSLLRKSVVSRMLVANKAGHDADVLRNLGPLGKAAARLAFELDRVSLKPYHSRSWVPFSIGRAGSLRPGYIESLKPDIVNLHWVVRGFLGYTALSNLHRPIVWTLRDMWPLTGGCHYSIDCEGYTRECGNCPVLGSNSPDDLSHKTLIGKAKAVEGADVTVVAISNWLAERAAASTIFRNKRIEVIHNALDHDVFRPGSKAHLRAQLNIPLDTRVIAFGAIDAAGAKIKGFHLLKEALGHLVEDGFADNTICLVFGSDRPTNDTDLGIPIRYLGRINDDSALAAVYGAADVMAVPSLVEAFGKTAMESMACGTPVVCFDTTGLRDIVDHLHNGYRAECYNSHDFAKGISWVLEDTDRWNGLSRCAREKVERDFTYELQAARYIDLYTQLLENRRGLSRTYSLSRRKPA